MSIPTLLAPSSASVPPSSSPAPAPKGGEGAEATFGSVLEETITPPSGGGAPPENGETPSPENLTSSPPSATGQEETVASLPPDWKNRLIARWFLGTSGAEMPEGVPPRSESEEEAGAETEKELPKKGEATPAEEGVPQAALPLLSPCVRGGPIGAELPVLSPEVAPPGDVSPDVPEGTSSGIVPDSEGENERGTPEGARALPVGSAESPASPVIGAAFLPPSAGPGHPEAELEGASVSEEPEADTSVLRFPGEVSPHASSSSGNSPLPQKGTEGEETPSRRIGAPLSGTSSEERSQTEGELSSPILSSPSRSSGEAETSGVGTPVERGSSVESPGSEDRAVAFAEALLRRLEGGASGRGGRERGASFRLSDPLRKEEEGAGTDRTPGERRVVGKGSAGTSGEPLSGSAASPIQVPSLRAENTDGGLEGAPSPLMLRNQGEAALSEGLSNAVALLRTRGGTQAQVVVEPPSLGRVDITLQLSGKSVEASFRVDNEGLRQVLQNQMDNLRSSLEAQGITVRNLSVDIRGGDERQNPREGAQERRGRRGLGGVEEDEGTIEAASLLRLDLEQGLLHWTA